MQQYPTRAKLIELCSTHNVEVFYCDRATKAENTEMYPRVGWYYWQCFPGCLPEGDAMGPHPSALRALREAYDNGYLGE